MCVWSHYDGWPARVEKGKSGLILMGDLPRKKKYGLIVMGDLPKEKERVVSFFGWPTQRKEWPHSYGWPTQKNNEVVSLWWVTCPMKKILENEWASGLMKTCKGNHTCTVEILKLIFLYFWIFLKYIKNIGQNLDSNKDYPNIGINKILTLIEFGFKFNNFIIQIQK